MAAVGRVVILSVCSGWKVYDDLPEARPILMYRTDYANLKKKMVPVGYPEILTAVTWDTAPHAD